MEEVLVTGATGRVGRQVAQTLVQAGLPVRRATTSPRQSGDVRFSFTDPATFHDAFRGVDRMFLMRPPQIGDVRRHGLPVPMTLITLALYLACRFGLAAGVTDDVRRLLGREPITLRQFAEDEHGVWL
ncbi:NAD(P)H-binding protein [Nonomuraea sp. NPDC050328]|uniref:NAD(P)H-binding protein n=1 Tax=Nonomuraea sp. NPDC050328 TaxID=3364361 RepID=UPI00378EFCE4